MAIELNQNNMGDFIAKVASDAKKQKFPPEKCAEILEEALLDIRDIKNFMADIVSEDSLMALSTGAWFDITDFRYNPPGGEPEPAKRSTMGMHERTVLEPGNWGYTILDAGRYGKFIEKFFYGGVGKSEPVADIPIRGGRRVELKSRVVDALTKKFKDDLPLGKIMDAGVLEGLNQIKEKGKKLEYTKAIMLSKFIGKMNTFLLLSIIPDKISSTVSSGQQSSMWIPILNPDGSSTNWEEATGRLIMNKFIYFFNIILENLLKLIDKEIGLESSSKIFEQSGKSKLGGGSIVLRNNKLEIIKIELRLKFTKLPNPNEISDGIMADPESIYAGKKTLFDIDSPLSEHQSKKFFDDILDRKIGKISRSAL